MVKCTVLYGPPPDAEAFERHYLDVHLPLGAQLPGLRRREVAKVVGPPSEQSATIYRITELYFDSLEAMEGAFSSDAGQRALADRASLAPGNVTVVWSELDGPED